MTNFQVVERSKPHLITPERAVLLIPIIAGAMVGVVLLLFGLIPLLVQVQEKRDVLQGMERKKSELPILRQQLAALSKKKAKSMAQQERLLNLVAGTTQLHTFLAQLNQFAVEQGVSIVKVEPQAIERPAPKPASPPADTADDDATAPPLPPEDPLLVQKLEKRSALLTVQGPFRRIVAFLQQMEQLQVIVIASDLELRLEAAKQRSSENSAAGEPVSQTTLKLKLSAYGRSSQVQN
ncbi:hypothetical protein PMIT1318_02171 [Prochlorococcus marinus str. MIT 1318]|uniref:hypothetical protein n=1 Tax=Prochlorococcus TaxID=1218 RepID=UPI0007B32629|nr:hypothetical protein [Prochlorococcus marinus]KZR71029.1 hypothetical protein PMIT1318_02171 [Prochlorococcus marinus str. MIT 1318]